MITVDDNYNITKECEYKEERYSVRDNGAILRHPKNGHVRPKDNIWTFGTKNEQNGYMFFTAQIRVHQVVCTAFHEKPNIPDLVVDHIDTNRCNNRPENLRWVTKLENILDNPITRRRVELCCGSIEAFLKNPSCLRSMADPNFGWMRTVTPEQAQICKRNLERWAQEDNLPRPATERKPINENIFLESDLQSWNNQWEKEDPQSAYNRRYFAQETNEIDMDDDHILTKALTNNAYQVDWKTPSTFPLCPQEEGCTLEDYYNNLKVGEIFANNQYNNPSTVHKFGITEDRKKIVVICTHGSIKGVPGYALTTIIHKDGYFFHKSEGSFFEEIGAEKYYTIEMGQEWTGGEVFDDFC